MCCTNRSSVVNLDLLWKQVFSYSCMGEFAMLPMFVVDGLTLTSASIFTILHILCNLIIGKVSYSVRKHWICLSGINTLAFWTNS
jgi:hypothetical protein